MHPAPKEQPPPETLRQKDRVDAGLWKAGLRKQASPKMKADTRA